MDLEDRISVSTPEGVRLELVVAGVGTRMAAALIDAFIQSLLVLAVVVVGSLGALAVGGLSGYAEALSAVAVFLIVFGYHVAFEMLASGRTPGKAAIGLRVVGAQGQPLGGLASVVRNLVRILDFLPLLYGTGLVAVLLSGRRQRLGDLAAGSVVIVERVVAERRHRHSPALPRFAEAGSGSTLDVSAVGVAELRALRRFLERRGDLPVPARARLAKDLAGRLGDRVAGWTGSGDEALIEAVVAAKSLRS